MTGRAPSSDPGIHRRRLAARVDLLDLHLAHPARYPHLLESSARGPHGCFDILFAFPGESLCLNADGGLSGGAAVGGDFLDALDAWWASAVRPAPLDADLPFHGGWFLYLGYELAGQVEPRLRLPPAPEALPTALATRMPAAVLRDHRDGSLVLVAEDAALLEAMAADIAALPAPRPVAPPAPPLTVSEEPGAAYLAAVARALDYIRDGDVFQANLSRYWRARLTGAVDDGALFRRLRVHNPAPFSALATFAGGSLLSSSPERLVRVRDGTVETRPIAGTRPRGSGAADAALSRELLGHPKERAEHVMLIDLERNDLGRVCMPGSVTVDELMVLESYAHVHHIVSNVRGRLRPGTGPGAVIRAVFPGGTITGCPKVRCMEIIAELEGVGRGPYTGSLGYLNRDGSMDLNILIRTLVRSGMCLGLRAGAGIVADSVPARELEETRAKARGLLLALGHDVAMADDGR